MANHDVWDAVVQTDGTPANSFEWLLKIFHTDGPTVTADITDLNPAFTNKTRNRETYAAKGVDAAIKYGSNLTITWNHEIVRDENGQYQDELQALIDASKANGQDNLIRLQVYDALGADYAFDGWFSIQVTRTSTGWDDKGWFQITATQNRFLGWIANPVLTGNIPLIASVLPTAVAEAGDVFIEGENFTGTTGVASVKFGGVNATSYVVVSDSLIAAVMPAGDAGSAPVIVTNPVGPSEAEPYVRGA